MKTFCQYSEHVLQCCATVGSEEMFSATKQSEACARPFVKSVQLQLFMQRLFYLTVILPQALSSGVSLTLDMLGTNVQTL